MPGTMRHTPALTRRRLLVAGAASAGLAALGIARPAVSRAADRPLITHGMQSGDVAADSGVVWARTDRPARMLVEIATTDSFKTIIGACRVDALPESDFTAKALLEDLPPARTSSTASRSQDLAVADHRRRADGRALPHRAERPALGLVRLVGRHRGPGLGHRRGARRHAHLRDHAAATGRTSSSIRGDTSMPTARSRAEQKLPNGEVWRNLVTEEKSEGRRDARRVSRQLQIQSARRATCAPSTPQVPMFAQWDDHEVTNDWSPGEQPLTTRLRRDATSPRSRRAAAARSTSSCRCARRRPSPAGSIARSPTGRCSTCSCSTCAAIAAPNGHDGATTGRRLHPRRRPDRLAEARARRLATRPGR